MTRETDPIVFSLAGLCKSLGVTSLIQVGAEDGYEAEMVRMATGCQATAIDADPNRFPISTGIDFHCTLIGASDCVTTFYVHETPGLSSAITREDGKEKAIEMQQYRLDSFCNLNGITPDALIIDTEGTTLDVLEGCGSLLEGIKVIYAEIQNAVLRPGMRLLPEVDAFLSVRGFTQHQGPPTYGAGDGQGNVTWVKP